LIGGLAGRVPHVGITAVLDAQDLLLGQVEAVEDGAVEWVHHLRLHPLYKEGGIQGDGPRVPGHRDQCQDQNELSNATPSAPFTTHSTCHFYDMFFGFNQTECFSQENVYIFPYSNH